MGWPVVIATNGYGIPVTESDSDFAIPAEIADNGYGTPVVLVDSGGTPVKGVGGGALPPVEETAPLYSDDFNAYSDGTQLTDVAVPADKRFTRTGAAGTTPTVVSGELATSASVFTEVGTSFIYREMGSDDHWAELTIGSAAGIATNKGLMFGAVDFNDRVGFRQSGAALDVKQVVAGVASSSLYFTTFLSTARFKDAALLAVGDRLQAQIINGRAWFYKSGARLGAAAGYAITPTGTRIGYSNGNHPWTGTTKLEAGPLLAKVIIGSSWSVPGQTPGTFVQSFPRIQGLGGYANGARDITVPITVIGGATSFVYWLSDAVSGKRLRISGTEVPRRVVSATSTGADTYNVVVRVPCGLTTYEDGTTRLGTLPYVLSVAPEIDTRGFDTHPTPFVVAYNILVVGQSNGVYFVGVSGGANGVTDHPGGFAYRALGYAALTPDRPTPATNWYNGTTAGDDLSGAGLTIWLSQLLDLPVMLTCVSIGATGASALDPDLVGGAGPWQRLHLAESGGAFDEIILNHGEAAVNAFTTAEALSWAADWITNLDHYLAYSGQGSATIPVSLIITGKYAGSTIDTGANIVRKAQDDIIDTLIADSIPAAILSNPVGIAIVDNVHYTQNAPAGAVRLARRAALSIAERMGLNTYNGRGPLIDRANASRAGAVITIPVLLNGMDSLTTLNGDGTNAAASATALTGWHVADSYNASTGVYSGDRTVGSGITSVELSGSDIVITLASDPGASVVVGNYFGHTPDVASWVFGLKTDATFGITNEPFAMEPIIDPLTVS